MTKTHSAAQEAAAPAPDERPPRREVVEETHETLDVMRLERTPRDQKLARELERLKDAAEVHFTERGVELRDADVESVRARVDALAVAEEKRPLPEARPPPPAPQPEPEPEEEAPQASLTTQERAALEAKVGAKIARVDTLYRTGAGHAVEVAFEKGGRTQRAPYILRGGEVADLDELGRVLDQMPLPEPRAPPAAPIAPAAPEAPTPAPADAEEIPAEAAPKVEAADEKSDDDGEKPKKKGLFGRKKEKAETPVEAPAEAAEAEPVKKRRFGLGKRGKDKDGTEPEGANAADAPAPDAAGESQPKKKGLFGRRKSDAPTADDGDDATAEDAAADDGTPAKKKRFGLRRK